LTRSTTCGTGRITVELAGDSKSTKIRLDAIRIWRNNKPDEDGFSLSGARTTVCFGSIARASTNAGRW
jgi:hypothetical protein